MELDQIFDPIVFDLDEVEKQIRGQLQTIAQSSDFADRVMSSFFEMPGKKLRPSLALLSAFAARGDNMVAQRQSPAYANLILLASVSELVHSASLMHDDVLDEADMRRGSPSLNARFGNRVAILAGDMLYANAFEMLAETTEKRVYMLLARCVRQMCRGEIVNLSEHDFEDYQQIVADKTAALMSFCCEAGAMMVSGGERDLPKVQALARFGYHYGMVYQLADDLGDCDDVVAMANRPKVAELIAEHRGAALRVLSDLSPSVYVSSLRHLLEYVVERSEPVMAAAAGST